MLMIDLDIYKAGGDAARRWWQGVLAVHNNGMELETWKQVTGGGGRADVLPYPPNWKFAVNAKTDINVDIRCQGGFAVLPPTKHASGKTYAWVDGYAPWEIEIALAPDWLLEEVERLIREHGGGIANARKQHANGCRWQPHNHGKRVNSTPLATRPTAAKPTCGIWSGAAVVDWYRECPIKPSERESVAKATEKYQVYEDQVSPQDRTIRPSARPQLLEQEGRGSDRVLAQMAPRHGAVGHQGRRGGQEARQGLWTKPDQNRGGFCPYTAGPDHPADPDLGRVPGRLHAASLPDRRRHPARLPLQPHRPHRARQDRRGALHGAGDRPRRRRCTAARCCPAPC